MTTGFIILRHTNSEETNRYWQHSYYSIRKFYPNSPIIILDDNSNPNLVSEIPLSNAKIIHTSGNDVGSGELLPYSYFYHNKWFDRAIIIHDGVFVNSVLDVSNIEDYQFMWHFENHHWDNPLREVKKLSVFNDTSLIEHHMQKNWNGCFGVMSIITHKFINKIYSQYNLDSLIPLVKTREDRMDCERIIASMFQYVSPQSPISKLGDIHRYCPWGIPFKSKEQYNHLPVIKIWTGR